MASASSGSRSPPFRDALRREPVLEFEHRGQQLVLARKMIVERALGDACRLGDDIEAHPRKTLGVEEPIGRLEDALARLALHLHSVGRSVMYTDK